MHNLSAGHQSLVVAAVAVSIWVLIVILVSITVITKDPVYPEVCIEKLEIYAGESNFSIGECKEDLENAEELRQRRDAQCR